MTEMAAVVRWAAPCEGDPKHRGLAHPLVACTLGLTVVVGASCAIHDVGGFGGAGRRAADGAFWGRVLLGYVAGMCALRLPGIGLSAVCYELLWACNAGMLLAAVGCLTGRPALVGAAVCTVAVDQVMWYVDVLGFALLRKWPVGVAKYMTWDTTTWARRVSSSHHLWFLPLTARIIGGVQPRDYLLSLCVIAVEALVSRALTPFQLIPLEDKLGAGPAAPRPWLDRMCGGAPAAEAAGKPHYLNVNLVYEVWKDVKFSFLQVSHPNPAVHLPRLLLIWGGLNLPCALLILGLSRAAFGG